MTLTEPTVEAIVHHDAAPKGRSLWSDARRRFLRNRAAFAALIVLALLVLYTAVGQFLSPFDGETADFTLIGINASKGTYDSDGYTFAYDYFNPETASSPLGRTAATASRSSSWEVEPSRVTQMSL